MDGFEVTGQCDADAQVADLVKVVAAGDSKQPGLSLAVSVVAQDDTHRSAASVGRVAEGAEEQRDVIVPGGVCDLERNADLGVERLCESPGRGEGEAIDPRSGRGCLRPVTDPAIVVGCRPSEQLPGSSISRPTLETDVDTGGRLAPRQVEDVRRDRI